jgi:hypothetical protein
MATTYDKIATTTLTSASANVSFNSFSGYTDLVLVINGKMTGTGNSIYLRFNDDTTSTYHTQALGNNSTVRSSNQFGVGLGGYLFGYDANYFAIEAHILDYANTTKYKPVISRYGQAGTQVETIVNSYGSATAVTSMKILINASDTFQSDSTFTLYGILRA